MSLHELLIVVGMLSALIALLLGTLRSATTVRDHIAEVGSVQERTQRIRAAVEETLRGGWPIPSLGLDTTGGRRLRLSERPRAARGQRRLRQWASPGALVCRTPDGYRVLALQGKTLTAYRVAGGRLTSRAVAFRVAGSSFGIQRAEGAGVHYRVALDWPRVVPDVQETNSGIKVTRSGRGPIVDGFVGFRLDRRPPATKERLVDPLPGGLR